jgi:hypothetical protein
MPEFWFGDTVCTFWFDGDYDCWRREIGVVVGVICWLQHKSDYFGYLYIVVWDGDAFENLEFFPASELYHTTEYGINEIPSSLTMVTE